MVVVLLPTKNMSIQRWFSRWPVKFARLLVCSMCAQTGWLAGFFCIFSLILVYAFLYGHLIIMILPCLVFSWRLWFYRLEQQMSRRTLKWNYKREKVHICWALVCACVRVFVSLATVEFGLVRFGLLMTITDGCMTMGATSYSQKCNAMQCNTMCNDQTDM